MDQLTFKYSVKGLEANTMIFVVEFDNPLEVSKAEELDKIVITFIDNSVLMDPVSGLKIE